LGSPNGDELSLRKSFFPITDKVNSLVKCDKGHKIIF